MPLPSWPELALFMGLVLAAASQVIVISGHFPGGDRAESFRTPVGTAIIWGAVAVTAVTVVAALAFAYRAVPWYAAVIGGGLMILVAPLLLQPLPDRFVDGRPALLLLPAIALALAAVALALVG